MKNTQVYFLYRFLIACLLILSSGSAMGQLNPVDTSQNIKKEEKVEWPTDSLGRRSPKGTVRGFIEAVAEENYEKAALYLDLSKVKKKRKGAELAQGLHQLVDKQGHIITEALLSDDPEGKEEKDLAPEFEIVGTATVKEETFNLVLKKTAGPQGGPIWLFAPQTVLRIPKQLEGDDVLHLDTYLPAILKENKWGGAPIGHWLFMIGFTFVGYLLSWALIWCVIALIRLFWSKAREQPHANVIEAFALPFRLYLTLLILVKTSQLVGTSIILRQKFGIVITIAATIVFIMLIWRLVEVISQAGKDRMNRRGNVGAVSAILFFRRGAKFLLVTLGIIWILNIIGIDVTTWIAALGIGGLALALGAQKSIENFVGSVTLIADHPIRVGDFCQIGDTIGTVEQIGMRSTQIRTLNRTIVTIPNGEVSSLKIENYTHRDQLLFRHILTLRYETTPEQIRYLLVELRAVLYGHPKVSPVPARVRFVELAETSVNLEVFALIDVRDFNEFLEIQEDLLLHMMEVVERSGTGFAFPSQTIYWAKDPGLSKEKSEKAQQEVRKWRESNELPLPKFEQQRIDQLKNSIPYPPEGSSGRKES